VSKHGERPPIRINPHASRRLAGFLLAAHGAALAVVLAVPLGSHWRAVLAGVVVGGLLHSLGAHIFYLVPWAVREADWASDGIWILTLVSGEQVEGRLSPSTYVTASLLVLNFRCGRWRNRALVLLPDSLDADLLRRLRVRLRLEGTGPSTDSDALT
jgi:toxin CptA